MKKIYPVLFHKFEKKTPNYYFQDFNWLMNDVGNYNLRKINSDFMDRLDKAKSYSSLISDEVAIKTKCLNGENALLEYAGCAVIISHDRWFLDRIATHILAFEGNSHVEWFVGNYDAYEQDKKLRLGEDFNKPTRIKYKPITR